jgi:hypothetical protein
MVTFAKYNASVTEWRDMPNSVKAQIKAAHRKGQIIQYRIHARWMDTTIPAWDPLIAYRVKPGQKQDKPDTFKPKDGDLTMAVVINGRESMITIPVASLAKLVERVPVAYISSGSCSRNP